MTAGSLTERELKAAGYDLLVVGHEYPSLPAWVRTWSQLECEVATFQHSPVFQHAATAFDGTRSRLYCYSPEMIERYAVHLPVQELAVHLGVNEEEPPATQGRDLVWLGRIDEEKAPHLAVRAAQLLGRRIRIVGPVFSEDYVRSHEKLLSADNVEWIGELGGPSKTGAIRDASVFVYTYARTYVEAGAAVFGESLRAGTPMAALTWREGTCAQAALCDRTGVTTAVPPEADDETAARALAEAIERAADLDHTEVQAIGQQRFHPMRHFKAMAAASC
ncbi:glycosyltransferase [Streptomyces lomondensis]|uniref:glycosyltransferase n=1 Tax=Streptomyces lomondensis TaxID=68229 RepID=UPI001E456659|nr:glycosyltransferase [Streptomyces lomondensis]MCF0078510.1 glycosyltransferase [Streptomyces lomondensis]